MRFNGFLQEVLGKNGILYFWLKFGTEVQHEVQRFFLQEVLGQIAFCTEVDVWAL